MTNGRLGGEIGIQGAARGDVVAPDEARQIVLDTYGQVAPIGTFVSDAMYPAEMLALLPEPVKELALGVGHPCGFADLQDGEVVLDLGCGGGIDTLLAAQAVGPGGRAIGLDITPEMVERAREHAELAGLDNVEFRQGSMEEIPLADETVDVIISNGVISMSPRKHQVFWEAWRVLKPGGRIVFGDMALSGPLPVEVRKHPSAVAGWLSTAVELRLLTRIMEKCGFTDVKVLSEQGMGPDWLRLYPFFTPEFLDLMFASLPKERHDDTVLAVFVDGHKR